MANVNLTHKYTKAKKTVPEEHVAKFEAKGWERTNETVRKRPQPQRKTAAPAGPKKPVAAPTGPTGPSEDLPPEPAQYPA